MIVVKELIDHKRRQVGTQITLIQLDTAEKEVFTIPKEKAGAWGHDFEVFSEL